MCYFPRIPVLMGTWDMSIMEIFTTWFGPGRTPGKPRSMSVLLLSA